MNIHPKEEKTSFAMKWTRRTLIALTGLLTVFQTASPQLTVTHDYPRKMLFIFGGTNADWISRFDVVHTSFSDSTMVRAAKQINPDLHVLATEDWQTGGFFYTGQKADVPIPWRMRFYNGTYVEAYDGQWYYYDPTQFCGRYTGYVNSRAGSIYVNNETFSEAMARFVRERVSSVFDGVASNGTWAYPVPANGVDGNLDINRNGRPDNVDWGTDYQDSIRKYWQAGWNNLDFRIRQQWATRYGSMYAKAITYNTVVPSSDTFMIKLANGVGWENAYANSPTRFSSWYPRISMLWDTTSVNAATPRLNFMTFDVYVDSANAPTKPRYKDYFRFVDWGLAHSLMTNNWYFNTAEARDHYWSNYYDAFDVPLGYPTSNPIRLSGGSKDGCYVRFFTGGVVILNPTNSTRTVTATDLQGLTGYSGPYYKWFSNQNPSKYDGQQFISYTLVATPGRLISQYVGDGLILVKTPTTVVSDIIIDNAYSGTSPGGHTCTLSGFSPEPYVSDDFNTYWTTICRTGVRDDQWIRQQYAAGGGSATAVYRPTINVPGQYRVYEWHGWHGTSAGQYTEATNVSHVVRHSGGTTTVLVDQSRNYGQWNLLGTFNLGTDGTASVTISSSGANGYVIADAIRFEYIPDSSSPPPPPPPPMQQSPPNGATNQPTTLPVSWQRSLGASHYNLTISRDTMFSSIVLNDTTLVDTFRLVSGLSLGTQHFVRLRAKNTTGWGTWSQTNRFTTVPPPPLPPTLQSPPDGAVNQPIPLTISWRRSQTATNYHLQVSRDSIFSLIALSDTTLSDTVKLVSGLSQGTQYFLRLRAKNAGGWGTWSNKARFTTLPPPPPPPVPSAPPDGATNQPTALTISWQRSQGASYYHLQVSRDSIFSTFVLNDTNVVDTFKLVSGLSYGVEYFVRIRAKNVTGWGSWSRMNRFATLPPVPLAPALRSPADNATEQPTVVTVLWQRSPGASAYNVQLTRDSSFATVLLNDTALTDTFRLLPRLANSMTYFVRLRAKNVTGWGTWSRMFRFSTTYPRTVVTGTVFFDQNNNRVRDAGEPGLAGWTIRLLGATPSSIMTDSSGRYRFDRVPLGSYTLEQIDRSGWSRTYPVNLPYSVAFVQDSTTFTFNFGNYAPTYTIVNAAKGWNVLSLPMLVSDRRTGVVFSMAITRTFGYDQMYSAEDTLENSRGYWVRFAQSHAIVIAGDSLISDTISVGTGWNLIGSVSAPISVDQIQTTVPDMLGPIVWEYRRSYVAADTILPGKGYWVNVLEPGNLIFSTRNPAGSPSKRMAQSFDFHGMNSLTLETKAGDCQRLYFSEMSNFSSDKDLYRMPPLPPEIDFDARFHQPNDPIGSLVAFFNPRDAGTSEVELSVHTSMYPVDLAWHVVDSSFQYQLITRAGKNWILAGSGKILLEADDLASKEDTSRQMTLRAIRRSKGGLPASTSLHPNYPNPFNSSTTLRFDLAREVRLRITLHNVLGQTITTIVDDHYAPGAYTVPFDASDLPTGVYFYKMQADSPSGESLVTVKRMVLVK